MAYENYLQQLSPCPECGAEDVAWCGISVRPYCQNCGNWGAVNYYPNGPEVAIKNWNDHYARSFARWQREDQYKLLDLYSKELGVNITIADLINFHRNHIKNYLY